MKMSFKEVKNMSFFKKLKEKITKANGKCHREI